MTSSQRILRHQRAREMSPSLGHCLPRLYCLVVQADEELMMRRTNHLYWEAFRSFGPGSRYYYYFYFIDYETETQKG